MSDSLLQRPAAYVLLGLGLLSFGLNMWIAARVAQLPYSGIDWTLRTGLVQGVAADGPAAGLIGAGEQIVTVNGVPPVWTLLFNEQWAGDQLHLGMSNAGASRTVTIVLSTAPPLVRAQRQVPVTVALVFSLVSMIVLVLRPVGAQRLLFFGFCQTFGLALALGTLSNYGPPWTIRLFHALIWWVGPLSVHLHLFFPARLLHPARRRLLWALYLVAVLGSFPDLVLDPLLLRAHVPWYFAASLLWLAICFGTAVALLLQAYRQQTLPAYRRQVGLVVLGGCVALVPFLALLVMPYALLHQPLLPDETAFLALMLIPLTYAYAVLDVPVPRLDYTISRTSAYTLVLALLAGFYLILNTILGALVPAHVWRQQTANLAIVVVLTATGGPLYRRLQLGVNHVLYGGSYDYRSAIELVSRTLEQPSDRATLAQSLCRAILTAMDLECVRLFLPTGQGELDVVAAAGNGCSDAQRSWQLAASGPVVRFFQARRQPIGGADLCTQLAEQLANQHEADALGHESPGLWIPLFTADELLGLCVLDYKRGGEPFDETDLDILQVITRLANIAIQNTELIAELRRRTTETEQVHQQTLQAREAERKRVARELHDQTIQALVGLNYQLSDLRTVLMPDEREQINLIQQTVRQTVEDVRRICADLRPPALDSLGLVPAIRSRLRELEQRGVLNVTLRVNGDMEQSIPEDIALCIFRVMQEALINVEKHAHAREVTVDLQLEATEVCLKVRDDGSGFVVPSHLGDLIANQHFGLVGLRERLDLVGGKLYVSSAVGQGTCVVARVPIGIPALLSQRTSYDD